ncbi:hypothetical protein GCM10028807_35430 [Spirosoma daeguense]
MHSFPVRPHFNLRKNKQVTLSKQLPATPSIGNRVPLPAGTVGYITSTGFENGALNVLFDTYGFGRHETKFNEFSAENYLECDPW